MVTYDVVDENGHIRLTDLTSAEAYALAGDYEKVVGRLNLGL